MATYDIIRLDEESAGPENDDFSDYLINDQGNSKSGPSYGRNAARSFWGRGYGPAGPPNQPSFPRENDTESFLLRCGVQKPTLKGLPKVLLRLMEPEYCGVCAHVFDNFDGARLHYISKNHSKNLKKWLAQQAKVGSKRPKEIPLRARELYCELCDIHITSKAHADSHYAGKPHRAIVEGRKIPKNPFLLQKNMQDRVEQLIRREKRSLKPTDKPAASDIANTVAKHIPPELYCDICKYLIAIAEVLEEDKYKKEFWVHPLKSTRLQDGHFPNQTSVAFNVTSVTCTEQMTMHLNGKKHLSKEKRHIFNMMKGATTIPKPAEPTATAKDADAQGEDAWEKWETNYYEDEFDWGHGSGTWDDDPQ